MIFYHLISLLILVGIAPSLQASRLTTPKKSKRKIEVKKNRKKNNAEITELSKPEYDYHTNCPFCEQPFSYGIKRLLKYRVKCHASKEHKKSIPDLNFTDPLAFFDIDCPKCPYRAFMKSPKELNECLRQHCRTEHIKYYPKITSRLLQWVIKHKTPTSVQKPKKRNYVQKILPKIEKKEETFSQAPSEQSFQDNQELSENDFLPFNLDKSLKEFIEFLDQNNQTSSHEPILQE